MNTSVQQLQNTLLDQICEAWSLLQAQQPLVHVMTNAVASNYVANILLAANASPAMIDNPFEAESFVKIAGALSLNLGTPTTEQVEAMQIAAKTAHSIQKSWVLDPVGYGNVLHWRSDVVDQLMTYQPTILRGMLQKLVLWLERISSLKASIALSIAQKSIYRRSPYWNNVNVSLFQVSLITSFPEIIQ